LPVSAPENIVDLGRETTQQIELIAAMPGSALGSTRDKPDTRYCQEILRVLQAHGTSYFFYIGGNDTADTLRIVSEEARKGRLSAALYPRPEDHRQ
jgi:6-phosphofructokinase